MAALNLPLITWCVIVAAMTVLITVRLFRKERSHMHVNPHMPSHQNHQRGQVIEIGSEREEFFVPGDNMSPK